MCIIVFILFQPIKNHFVDNPNASVQMRMQRGAILPGTGSMAALWSTVRTGGHTLNLRSRRQSPVAPATRGLTSKPWRRPHGEKNIWRAGGTASMAHSSSQSSGSAQLSIYLYLFPPPLTSNIYKLYIYHSPFCLNTTRQPAWRASTTCTPLQSLLRGRP